MRVDFFLEMDLNQPYMGPEGGLRPFEHFSRFNVIELKGETDRLSESRLRYYVGRTLVLENPYDQTTRKGQISLTVLCLSKPVKLLKMAHYGFKRVSPWKYQTTMVNDLPVTIILLRELQKVKGGDALAWLQILEPNKQRRYRVWNSVLNQELYGRNQLIGVMMELDKEDYMTIAEELRQEGRQEGLQEGVQKGREEVVREMILQGINDNLILKLSRISMEQLQELKCKYKNP